MENSRVFARDAFHVFDHTFEVDTLAPLLLACRSTLASSQSNCLDGILLPTGAPPAAAWRYLARARRPSTVRAAYGCGDGERAIEKKYALAPLAFHGVSGGGCAP